MCRAPRLKAVRGLLLLTTLASATVALGQSDKLKEDPLSAPDGDLPGAAVNMPVGVARIIVRDMLQKRRLVKIPEACIACGVPLLETKFLGTDLFETRSLKLTNNGLSFDVDKAVGTKRSTVNVRLVFNTLDYVSVYKATSSTGEVYPIVSNKGRQFQQQVGDELVFAFNDLNDGLRFMYALNRLIYEAYLDTNGLLAETSHGTLGIALASVGKERSKSLALKVQGGAFVNLIAPGGAAEKAGLKTGDVILAMNGTPITNAVDLRRRLMNTHPDDDMVLDIFRNGNTQHVKVHLDASRTLADTIKTARAKAPDQARTEALEKYRVLAEQAFRERDFPAAVENYEKGIAMYPAWAEGWFNAALLYGELGEYEYAAKRMKIYLSLMPDAADAKAAREKVIIWEEKAKNE